MSGERFTPGPWRVMNSSKPGFSDIYTTHETGCCVDNVAHDFICEVGPGDEERRANAYLISSAPELLDALYMALPYVEDALDDDCFKPGVVAKHAKTIRQVIAKAEGEI